ncbi:hypothetical protein PIB30_021998, partial [Stylosanthes scabra]|nr:hypothetical protein [Stylosanthes scabra]
QETLTSPLSLSPPCRQLPFLNFLSALSKSRNFSSIVDSSSRTTVLLLSLPLSRNRCSSSSHRPLSPARFHCYLYLSLLLLVRLPLIVTPQCHFIVIDQRRHLVSGRRLYSPPPRRLCSPLPRCCLCLFIFTSCLCSAIYLHDVDIHSSFFSSFAINFCFDFVAF